MIIKSIVISATGIIALSLIHLQEKELKKMLQNVTKIYSVGCEQYHKTVFIL